MILMTVGNSEGERRCDAKCYNATSKNCGCICGGMNHGVGLKQAKANTSEHAEQLAEKLKIKLPPLDALTQGELF